MLEELYRRGKALPEIAPSLHAGDGLLFFWSHEPVAPWQTEAWLAEMRRTMRPNAYARMIQNQFVPSESTFIDLTAWDACVQPALTPVHHDRQLHVWVGVDASTKRNSTALVACTFDKKAECVRLVAHRVFTPAPDDPINFEQTVEATLLDWRKRYLVRKVWFDPFQMVSVAQRLTKAHVPIEEYPQSGAELDGGTSEPVRLDPGALARALPRRRHAARSLPRDHRREQPRLANRQAKQRHQIDVIVALSMAALAAIRGQSEHSYDLWACFPDHERTM